MPPHCTSAAPILISSCHGRTRNSTVLTRAEATVCRTVPAQIPYAGTDEQSSANTEANYETQTFAGCMEPAQQQVNDGVQSYFGRAIDIPGINCLGGCSEEYRDPILE
jgi:hypothetical protein